ncbi:MAG: hypothetical protein PHW73_11390 [Atribacterota bacterium]|nr:hypothetical protein [Atribacterota bacterium]
MAHIIDLSRSEKLILVMFEMGGRNVKFEDIVVRAFKKFPSDFHLKGYEEYPDSGDLVHKPLYELRKKGLLEANNKIFSFTDRGLVIAREICDFSLGKTVKNTNRFSRYVDNEINRVRMTDGFKLFISGKQEEINDTDFYSYLSVTPRTSKNDFIGRLNNMNDIVKEMKERKDISELENNIVNYHNFILGEKFKSIVDFFRNN